MRKHTVDDAYKIDLADLRRWGDLRPGSMEAKTLTWSNLFTSYEIAYFIERDSDEVHGIWIFTPADDQVYKQGIHFVQTPCHLGGVRQWFLCPECNGRCRIIYLAPGRAQWECRECAQLTYRSRQRSGLKHYERTERIVNTLEQLLRDLDSRSPRRQSRALRRLKEMDLPLDPDREPT